ncbi:MAG: hypothetical protein AAFY22_02440 [Pseudomonadota bacterium]
MIDHHMDPENDLGALWRSDAAAFDPADLRKDIEKDDRLRQYIFIGTLIVSALIFIWIVWLATRGVFRAPFLLPALIALSFLREVWRWRRSHRRTPEVASLDPGALLEVSIEKAKKTLRTARMLYAGNPSFVALGILLGPLFVSADAPTKSLDPLINYVAVGIIVLIIASVGVGLRMASTAKTRIAALTERLKKFREDV